MLITFPTATFLSRAIAVTLMTIYDMMLFSAARTTQDKIGGCELLIENLGVYRL